MGNITKRLLSLLLVLTMVVSMGALQVFAAEDDLAQALAAAEAAYKESGVEQVVTLTGDLNAESIIVPNGVVLDCNSQVVTVGDLAVFGDIANTGNGGRLHISGNCSIVDGASAIAVYLPDEDCYILTSYAQESLGVREKNDAVIFGYAPKFADAATYDRIANGGKVRAAFSLSWTGCENPLVFDCSDELMAEYAQMVQAYANLPVKVALQLNVTNMEVLGSGKDVYITPVLKNEMGIVAYGEAMHYVTDGVKVDVAKTENGSVTTDTNYYEIGNTITLTVTPDEGYVLESLSVLQDGQSIDIGEISYKGGQYSFVAEQDAYTVDAKFKQAIFTATQGNWDLSNQFDGSITITEQKDGTTVTTVGNKYDEVAVTVSDLTPSYNEDGTLKQGNFSMQISFLFDNGKKYEVRLHNTDANGLYKLQNIGSSTSVTGTSWKWLVDLTEEQVAKLLSGGVEFRVKLADHKALLMVDGTVMATVDLGADSRNVAQIKLCMNGNAGMKDIEIPFALHEVKPYFTATKGEWDLSNQYDGSITILEQKDGTTVTTNAGNYKEVAVTVSDLAPTYDESGKGNFSMQISFLFDNGKKYEVRLHNTDANGLYKLQNIGSSTSVTGTGWKWLVDLTEAQVAKLLSGGVEFAVKLVDGYADLWVDNTLMASVDLGADARDMAQIKLCMNGNTGVKDIVIPFALRAGAEEAAPVQMVIAETTNGTVTASHTQYQVGDTVTLAVAPAEGYALKSLVVKKDGEAINVKTMNGTTNRFVFVAEAGVYTVEAEFAEPIFTVTKGNWDLNNQFNGSITITEQKDGTTVTTVGNNYEAVSATIRDLAPTYDENGKGNFSFQISMLFENGKKYEVRLHNTDANSAEGKYKLQNIGSSTSVTGTGWKWQADLTSAQVAKLLGDGVEFTVKLAGTNAELWVDGTLMVTVDLGADSREVAQISLCMNGNAGQKNIEIPFELKVPEPAPAVQLNIAELTGGTVTPALDAYQVGDTITLSIAPEAGYSQKLYINGQPLLLGFNATTFSFEATEEIYNITGSFKPSLNVSAGGRWFAGNQAHGVLNAYYPSNNDAWRIDINGEYRSVAIMVKNFKAQEDTMEGVAAEAFSAVVSLKIGDTRYGFRVINKGAGKSLSGQPQYEYSRFGAEGATGWGGKCALEDKVPGATAKINGEGIEFKVTRISADTLQITLDGVILDTYTISGVTDADKVTAATIYHYGNKGEQVVIPYELQIPEAAPVVQLNIPELVGGAIVPAQEIYQVGDTVTLGIVAEEGYSQKLYINGQPAIMNADGTTCSFVATEAVYEITGSFEPNIFSVVKGNWNLANQQFGSVSITKQADATAIITNGGDYSEVSVKVKDYTPSKNEDGSLKKGNFSAQVYFIFDNGKQFQVRIHNSDADGNYKIQTMGDTNSFTKWKWRKDLTTAQKAALLDGDGVTFTVKIVGTNAEMYIDGTKMATVALEENGVSYDGSLAQVKLLFNGSVGVQNIEMPYTLK